MRHYGEDRCAVCGGRINPETDTEILDGYVCEDCISKLSPWFDEFKYAEVDELKEQMRLRERIHRDLDNFHPTRKFGEEGDWMLLVDDEARTFVVTDTLDLEDCDSEVIHFENVTYCDNDVDDECDEIAPKLDRYSYTFNISIDLDHPYLENITYQLNEEPLEYEVKQHGFLGLGGHDPEEEPDYMEYQKLAEKICKVLNNEDDGEDDDKYAYNPDRRRGGSKKPDMDMEETPKMQPKAVAAGDVIICPWCGSKVTVGDNFRCGNCGGPL